MDSSEADSVDQYRVNLSEYLRIHGEAALYQASQLGRAFVESGLGPDEIIAVHAEALERAMVDLSFRQMASAGVDGLQFLLEVMIAYGVHHQQYLELRVAEVMQHAQQFQETAQNQSEIMAMISHELRTPVTALKGSLDLAARSLARRQLEQASTLIDGARRALDRLSHLTADLYQASRGTNPEISDADEDLCAIVEQSCDWAEEPAAEKGITLIHEPSPASLPIRGDADALLSVVSNLLSNAIRYTPQGGRVTVRHGADARRVWLEIEDTGIGMSPEVQDRVFEKFYRAPEAIAIERQGLGLGLSLARQLALAHQGDLTIESTSGRGSTFRLTLPRRP